MRNRNLFPEKKYPVVTAEVRDAWEVVAKFMNKHPTLSFHISPWDAKDDNKYTLQTFIEETEVNVLSAETKWKSKDKGGH